jgi:two-component system response regulator
MKNKTILLVEDNPDDEALTLRALSKNNIMNEVVVARDGAEALDYLFCRNAHAERGPEKQPALILLDLKLPKVDGLDVLREIRANPATQLLRV